MVGATKRQRSFLIKLIDMVKENGGSPPIDFDEVDSEDLTIADASAYISEMKDDLGLD